MTSTDIVRHVTSLVSPNKDLDVMRTTNVPIQFGETLTRL
jgi:hypothetical protein